MTVVQQNLFLSGYGNPRMYVNNIAPQVKSEWNQASDLVSQGNPTALRTMMQ